MTVTRKVRPLPQEEWASSAVLATKIGALADRPFFVPRPCPLGSLRATSWTPRAASSTPAATARRALGPRSLPAVVVGAPRWPRKVEAAVESCGGGFGCGWLGLVPRGSLFCHMVNDPLEPTRSGVYQFCVVGIDFSIPSRPLYHCWEPTGRYDRIFAADEIERLMAIERYGRAVAVRCKTAPRKSDTADKVSCISAVRWPDVSSEGPFLSERLLPEVDEAGFPILPAGCRCPPRNSIDLLGPMIETWRRRCLPVKLKLRVLVFDATGRWAKHLQETFQNWEVESVDVVGKSAAPHSPRTLQKLGRLRKSQFPVRALEADWDASAPLPLEEGAADVVLLPFPFLRLCRGEEARFTALLGALLRVALHQILLAEEIGGGLDDAAFLRWKGHLQATMGCRVLLDSELGSAQVPDHFLSASGGESSQRRFLIIDAAAARRRQSSLKASMLAQAALEIPEGSAEPLDAEAKS